MSFIVEQTRAEQDEEDQLRFLSVQSVSARATGTGFRSLVPGTSFKNDPVLLCFLFTPTTSEAEVLQVNRC